MKYISFHTYLRGVIPYTIPHLIPFSQEFVVLLEVHLWRWNMIDSETEMKKLGGNIQYNAHKTRSSICAIKHVKHGRHHRRQNKLHQ